MLCIVILVILVTHASALCVSGPMPTQMQYKRMTTALSQWRVPPPEEMPFRFALDACPHFQCEFTGDLLQCTDDKFDHVAVSYIAADNHFWLTRNELCLAGLTDFFTMFTF